MNEAGFKSRASDGTLKIPCKPWTLRWGRTKNTSIDCVLMGYLKPATGENARLGGGQQVEIKLVGRGQATHLHQMMTFGSIHPWLYQLLAMAVAEHQSRTYPTYSRQPNYHSSRTEARPGGVGIFLTMPVSVFFSSFSFCLRLISLLFGKQLRRNSLSWLGRLTHGTAREAMVLNAKRPPRVRPRSFHPRRSGRVMSLVTCFRRIPAR